MFPIIIYICAFFIVVFNIFQTHSKILQKTTIFKLSICQWFVIGFAITILLSSIIKEWQTNKIDEATKQSEKEKLTNIANRANNAIEPALIFINSYFLVNLTKRRW